MLTSLQTTNQLQATDTVKHSRNYGLDLFRAVAISLVIFAHFSQALEILGVLGVELFFVLSGYLIGGIFIRQVLATPNFNLHNLFDFLRRRWIRTVPNYYLFFVIQLVIAPLLGHSISSRILLYTVFCQNLAWQIAGFYSVSWSLAVEEWFYLLFPGLVFLLIQFISKRAAFVTVIVLIISVPTALRIYRAPSLEWELGIRMVVAYRLDALMFGVSLAYIKMYLPNIWPRLRYLVPLGIALAVISLAILRHIPTNQPSLHAALVFSVLPLASAFMLPFAEHIKRPAAFINASVTSISKWSYSIYLSHIPVLFLLYHFTDPFHFNIVGKLFVKIFALACTIYISKLLYERFEVPIMNLRDRKAVSPAVL